MLGVALLSLPVGLLLGFFGGGGSILAVPVLVHVAGLPARSAIATSLLLVSASSFTAMLVHARHGHVRLKTGAFFASAAMVGAFAGGRLSRLVSDSLLVFAFTVLMFVIGALMLRQRPRALRVPGCDSSWCMLVLGMGTGLLTGLLGAGGGFIVVPALALLGGLSVPDAVGTSLLVVFASSLAGFLGHLGHATINTSIAVASIAASVAGSYAGALLSKHVSPDSLRRGFAVFVLGAAAFMGQGALRTALARTGDQARTAAMFSHGNDGVR